VIEVMEQKRVCNICNKRETSIHAEAESGKEIWVCESCLDRSKANFIFICMDCGKVFIRPKKPFIDGIHDRGLKEAYTACKDMQLIQGIDGCSVCDPEGFNVIQGGHC